MKKTLSIVVAVVVVVVLVAVYLKVGGKKSAEPKSSEDVVKEMLEPRPPPAKKVELSPVEFEMVEVTEVIENLDEAAPAPEMAAEPEVVAAVRVRPDQVLVIVNGRPLTGKDLMPPGRFKKNGARVVPKEALKEVLERSIERELIFQEAETQGVTLGERGLSQLDGMYEHLTGNPLNLPEGQTVLDLGNEGDAVFHVREQAARLLQLEFLNQAGEPETAEARLAFRERLKGDADIQVVDLEPPEE